MAALPGQFPVSIQRADICDDQRSVHARQRVRDPPRSAQGGQNIGNHAALGQPSGAMDVVWRLLTQPVHLWYFYAAAGLYLLAPVLSVFTRHATHRQFVYGLVLTGASGCGIVILLRTSHFPLLSAVMEQTKLPYATGFLFCYLLGYYLFRYPLERRGLILWGAAGLLGWGITFAGTFWLSARAGAWNDLLLSFYAPNVVVTSAAVFAWVQRVFGRWVLPDRVRRLLAGAAGTTGGIYGLHMLLLWLLTGLRLSLLVEAAGVLIQLSSQTI